MPFVLKCKKCNTSFRVPDSAEGKWVKCTNCGLKFVAKDKIDFESPAPINEKLLDPADKGVDLNSMSGWEVPPVSTAHQKQPEEIEIPQKAIAKRSYRSILIAYLPILAVIIATYFFVNRNRYLWKPNFMPTLAQEFEEHHEEDGYIQVEELTYLHSDGMKIQFSAKESYYLDHMTIWYDHENRKHTNRLLSSIDTFAYIGNYIGKAERDINIYAIRRCINADWDEEPIGVGSELNGGSIFISKFVFPKEGENTRTLQLQEKNNH